ncbi:hypothetical protein UFOVP244_185 [uncultured Caudovirales phage]|uniref:Uncharacterized protein n=1 Tax=uncultured Caudovirales phage TaxID=2100421 RepID=A0A6J7WU67_9CAUD|nr:hypothetical protein UFOVP244_185 [uncultured Caudovirales phage]
MAGKGVKFLSGPRIRITVGGNTISYAIGLNVSVSISVTPVMILGKYSVGSFEPVAYNLVRGTMVLVKQKVGANDNLLQNPKTATAGEGSNGTNLASHLDPELVLLSQTFDLDIMVNTIYKDKTDPLKINTRGQDKELLRIYDCRLTSHSNAITVGQALNDTLSFEGLMALDQSGINSADPIFDTPSQRTLSK